MSESAPPSIRLEVPPETGSASWLITRRELDELERFAPLCRGRLLDLGCGRLPHYRAFAPLVDEYWALDHPSCRHFSQEEEPPADVRFVWGDAERLPFADDAFDTVLLLEVLEHLPRPWQLWSELARTLRPGGHVFLSTPFLYQIHEAPRDFYRYTEFGHRSLAEGAGFEPLWIRPKGGVPSFAIDFSSKLAWSACHKARLPKGWIGWLQRGLYRAPGLGRETLGASRFPLGYCVAARLPERAAAL